MTERRNGNGGRREADDQAALLARIDERTETMVKQMSSFVTRDEFKPVRNAVYGVISLLMTAVFVALVAGVLG